MVLIFRQHERGVSLVEALISVGLLFIIAAGILPLFARSLANNAAGADATNLTLKTRDVLEDAASSDFNQADWTIPGGATTVLRDELWFTDQLASDAAPKAPNEGRWFPFAGAPNDRAEGPRWLRRTQVWQFGVGQWVSGQPFDTTTAYDGTTLPDFVQLKLVEVDVRSYPRNLTVEGAALEDRWSSLLGTQRPMRVRYIKAF
jgi:type II secretory pathway pseudopilin PulG